MDHRKPIVLALLDGWGLDEAGPHNGISQAQTPCFDSLLENYPNTTLDASGEAVGLPDGQVGNSEVGHTTIGAGTIIYQDLVRINKAVEADELKDNPAFQAVFEHVKEHDSQLHILGLLSQGGVHSHENHLFALVKAAAQAGIEKVVIHPFTDGRDSAPTGGAESLRKLEELIADLTVGHIASVTGRYYAMDRDKNWDRTDKAARAIFHGEAERSHDSEKPSSLVANDYQAGLTDEFIEPVVFLDLEGKPKQLEQNDGIIFINFRTDRTRQLSQRIVEQAQAKNWRFATMTDYGQAIDSLIAFPPSKIKATMASQIAEHQRRQLHIAETEKFAHVTYFLNGGEENPYPEEEQLLIPSNKDIKTHDEKPEMKAKEITDSVLERLDQYDFIFINYANPDMVGHTANQPAIITAVETVDRELKRIVDATLERNGLVLVMADHGNAERMVDPVTNQPHTAHTNNPVPFILVGNDLDGVKLQNGKGLQDVAPTVLELLGLPIPPSMTGESLVIKK